MPKEFNLIMFSHFFAAIQCATVYFIYTNICIHSYILLSFLFEIKVQPAREDIEGFHGTDGQASCIAKVLSASQKYMRQQEVNAVYFSGYLVTYGIRTVIVEC